MELYRSTFPSTVRAQLGVLAAALALASALLLAEAGEARAGIGFEWARSSTTKLYQESGDPLRFQWELKPKSGRTFQIDVVRIGHGAVQRLEVKRSPTGVQQSYRWWGRNFNGKYAKTGEYVFKVRNPNTGKLIRMRNVRGKRAFGFHRFIFPVRGSHNYGDRNARFGAGRSGHSHQGQDLFARCGTKLRAPHAGKIAARGYHSAAGHYVVVTMPGTGLDAVFMHLRHRSWAKPGWEVRTGEQIGKVGETGNASGCHLHFELWKSPGWYRGGRPFNPLRMLRRWDSWS